MPESSDTRRLLSGRSISNSVMLRFAQPPEKRRGRGIGDRT
jgi:hypothetical protein